ncbi:MULTISPECIES: Dabb family protein [Arcicella]|uniref:Dabb family protein n=1 Tax=Arcicella lustrica TaxID=2984196 RepID=A0ABU5SM02_9BACT|nr:Dabb family protein [Arcicella sp. DC25W]MEA5428295.1 Dabb family protein [Arcicella sp. DC25W]
MQKSSRRQFLENSATALATGTIMTSIATTDSTAAPKGEKLSFIHHVYFWLKDPNNKKDHDQLLAALKALGKIEVIKSAHIGLPSINDFDKPVTDASYSFSVLLIFDSKEDEEKYLVHPLHKKFGAENHHLWSKVVVYDSADIYVQ